MTECGKAADLEPVRVEAEKLIVECAGDVEPQRAKRVGRYARFVEREQFWRDGGAARKVGGLEAALDDAVQRLADEHDGDTALFANDHVAVAGTIFPHGRSSRANRSEGSSVGKAGVCQVRFRVWPSK